MSRERERALRADRWRAGLLAPEEARRFEQEMRGDAALAEQARFGARTARALDELPRLAAHRASHRPLRGMPRRARWARLAAAGALSACLAGMVAIGLAGWPVAPSAPAPQVSAQTADAVQNIEFYEWLAAHPQALDDSGGQDEG